MKFSKRSLNNLKGVHPDLVKVMHEAIKDTPIDFTVTEGVRTVKRQQHLYAQGRNRPGMIVTYVDGVKKKSNHQLQADGYGYAVDIYPFINGKVEVCGANELELIAWHIGKVAEKLGIPVEWGGNWKFKDYPHFELKR